MKHKKRNEGGLKHKVGNEGGLRGQWMKHKGSDCLNREDRSIMVVNSWFFLVF